MITVGMPILIGVAAVACRMIAGTAVSAEAATAPLRILRRVTVWLVIMASSLIVEFSDGPFQPVLDQDGLFQLHGFELRR